MFKIVVFGGVGGRRSSHTSCSCIRPNFKIYLLELLNVFVQKDECICSFFFKLWSQERQGGEGQATPAALDDHNLVPGSIHVASSGSIQNTKFTTKYKIHNRRQTHKIQNMKYKIPQLCSWVNLAAALSCKTYQGC